MLKIYWGGGGGLERESILMYTRHIKSQNIHIHQLKSYTVLSVNHILHLNYVCDELLRSSMRLWIIVLTYMTIY